MTRGSSMFLLCKLMIGFLGETLRAKNLLGKILMNHWLFVKFINVIHRQTFVPYSIAIAS